MVISQGTRTPRPKPAAQTASRQPIWHSPDWVARGNAERALFHAERMSGSGTACIRQARARPSGIGKQGSGRRRVGDG